MLPMNHWNSLTLETRANIADTILGCSVLDTAMYRDLAFPYHHNFDYDETGRQLKALLQHLNLQKDGTINITINVRPKYAKAAHKPKPKAVPQETPLKHFRVRYLDERGDLTNVHLYAENATQAKEEAKHEYWDIESIIEVTEID